MKGLVSFFPDPKEYPAGRLFSLDLLRGLDMFYLVVLLPVIYPLFPALGVPQGVTDFLCIHPWEGFAFIDIVMPLFMFMCGAAVPFALGRRMTNGRPSPGYWRHVGVRFALLWILGMLIQGNLAELNLHTISPYSNTLQTIAVGYVVAAVLFPVRSWMVKVGVPVALTVAYGLIVHFGGDYTQTGNVTVPVELAILRAILPADNSMTAVITKWGYTWFLPSLIFPVLALAGCQATEILRSRLGEWGKAVALLAFGSGSLLAGWLLSLAGVKVVKHIFSVSFTLEAIGWCVLALAALYVLTDIWRLRRGRGVFLLFGQHALAAYVLRDLFNDALVAISNRIFVGCRQFFPAACGDAVIAAGSSLVLIFLLALWRRYKLKNG